MTYNPSEDLKRLLHETDIISYRTTDGSYVIAEEVDFEESLNITYVAQPLELVVNNGRSFLQPWLMSDEEEVVEIFGDKIVGRAETAFELKMHYHRFCMMEKLRNVLNKDEMNMILNDMFNPQVDKQDFTEDDEWIPEEESVTDIHMEWRRKQKNN